MTAPGCWYGPLTEAERDTLRQFLHQGNQEAFKLAAFAAPSRVLWEQAQGTAREIAAAHLDLCQASPYAPVLVATGTGWPVP